MSSGSLILGVAAEIRANFPLAPPSQFGCSAPASLSIRLANTYPFFGLICVRSMSASLHRLDDAPSSLPSETGVATEREGHGAISAIAEAAGVRSVRVLWSTETRRLA